MLQLSDIPELISDYASGDVDWMIAYSVLLRLLGDHEVAEVMSGLTPELAAQFDSALHESFYSDDFVRTGIWKGVWIDNAAGEPPNLDQILARIRRWLVRA